MDHLCWHKPRLVVLGPKIRGLPDNHPSKAMCLYRLSEVFNQVANYQESKAILCHALELWRRQGNDLWAAKTLERLCDANRCLYSYDEGIQQAEEGLEIYRRLGDVSGEAWCLRRLGFVLYQSGKYEAAEEAASRAIELSLNQGQRYQLCISHRLLASVYRVTHQREKAIANYQAALDIVAPFGWQHELFWTHLDLALLFLDEARFDDAQSHIQQTKSHAADNQYFLGRATDLQADLWNRQKRYGEAKSETLRAIDIYERIGAVGDLERCTRFLQDVEKNM